MSKLLKENALLVKIEKSSEYKQFKKDTESALYDQWEDLVLSGLVAKIYDDFWSIFQEKSKKEVTKWAKEEINRLILTGKIASLKKLERFITDKTTKKIKQVGWFSGYGMSIKTYIYKLFNKWWQAELNRYLGTDKLTFTLSKEYYRQKIRDRARVLIKWLDEYTVNRFAKELIKWLDKWESKKKLTDRLLKVGSWISKERAERIVRTETAAAVEYMRHETARLNWVQTKTWKTTADERTCPVCRPMHDITVNIWENFPYVGLGYPPVHPSCRCTVDYNYKTSSCWLYVKSAKATGYKFYDYSSDLWLPCTNPECVWAWWNSLIWKDKNISFYSEYLWVKSLDKIKEVINHNEFIDLSNEILLISEKNKKVLTDVHELQKEVLSTPDWVINWSAKWEEFVILAMAKAALTDLGYIQLMRHLLYGQKGRPSKIPL